MFDSGLTRRSLLTGTLAAGSLGLAGIPLARAEPQWKKFSGSTLEVNLIKSPRGDILQKYEKEFTELTGIKVASEQIPEQQQRQKAVIELTSGKPSFDVVHLSYHVQKRQFEKAKWLADFSAFLKDASLTEATLTESDFSSAGLLYARNQQGEMRSLPFSVDYWIVYWNKELFAKKGLQYPETFDDMVRAAEALTDPKEGIYGFVARGLRNANVPVWTSFLLGHGVDPVDASGNLLTDGPEAIEAAKLYQRLLTKAAPPGVAGFNWSECQSAFLQGKIGMWLDGVGFAPPLEDPTKSRVVGKVGYGVMPRGPKTRASATFGDGIGVTEASQKKEAGYLYCQWAISKLMGGRLLQTGSGVPFRHSVLNDAEIRQGVKMPAAWVDAVAESAKISRLGLPVVIPVTEFRDIIGTGLTATLSGGDPAAEMRKATEQFKPVLERSERA
ncbi:sugar ABC transporter substrate-binding protein [Chelatococcus sp. SYSU_G07232]|uniref:Sugar ABC transporter substrate-binding protein n=1 Tax=Chelatococcus albus TaxID=3047466 RepID=A0ABT7AEG9_9HYPH|nr:sugar ABC transporter substrate-binding protein [Chelatococcus sp. SYSU_G07232]MDJ1157495.1 sugar ABC transporter substrate-binding protein [Chelatococcus sp. SYSU_G07232]